MNGLILHCGSAHVTRDQLRDVPTPEPTATWHPVSHHRIAELVVQEAEHRGCRIAGEDYGLNPSGTKLFGVLKFHPDGRPDYTRALGFRNSHDKSLALGLTAGISVFCCDNLALSGDVVMYRRHTIGIEVETLIGQAFDSLNMRYQHLEESVEVLRRTRLSLDEARLLTVEAAEAGAIPGSDILPVLAGFRNPLHVEFAEPTRWALYNSFTEMAKTYSPARADTCYRTLAPIFGLG